jgi:hypothetical protein
MSGHANPRVQKRWFESMTGSTNVLDVSGATRPKNIGQKHFVTEGQAVSPREAETRSFQQTLNRPSETIPALPPPHTVKKKRYPPRKNSRGNKRPAVKHSETTTTKGSDSDASHPVGGNVSQGLTQLDRTSAAAPQPTTTTDNTGGRVTGNVGPSEARSEKKRKTKGTKR